MTRTVSWMLAAVLMAGTSGVAAQPPAAPGQPARPAQEASEPAPSSRPEATGQPVNIRVVLSITDERAGQPAETKTVSMLTADGVWGRVRAEGQVRRRGIVPVQLNVDARPLIAGDGLIRLELILFHQLVDSGGEADEAQMETMPTRLNESLAVFLRSGTPLVISEAVDPATSRKTRVELTATVLK